MNPADEKITRLLFVRNTPAPADLAIVFSCIHEPSMVERAEHAVQLYNKGLFPKILMSGGGSPPSAGISEAAIMADIAYKLNVPPEDILIEPASANTHENVAFSLALLHSRNLLSSIKTIMLITSGWHMRRVLLIAKQMIPPEIKLLCCPADKGCPENSWTDSEECRRLVLSEHRIIQAFLKAGIFSMDTT